MLVVVVVVIVIVVLAHMLLRLLLLARLLLLSCGRSGSLLLSATQLLHVRQLLLGAAQRMVTHRAGRGVNSMPAASQHFRSLQLLKWPV